ncbi:MAG: DNA helicase UvrD, partial [Verrucomicrobia bacterium]
MSRQYTLQRAPRSTSIHVDYAAELNEQQLAAVTAPPGPILVIAGAGSGKTRTLTYRVAYLLENGIDPQNILLLTFTNKAAREMLNRVANLLPVDAGGLWGGT